MTDLSRGQQLKGLTYSTLKRLARRMRSKATRYMQVHAKNKHYTSAVVKATMWELAAQMLEEEMEYHK